MGQCSFHGQKIGSIGLTKDLAYLDHNIIIIFFLFSKALFQTEFYLCSFLKKTLLLHNKMVQNCRCNKNFGLSNSFSSPFSSISDILSEDFLIDFFVYFLKDWSLKL